MNTAFFIAKRYLISKKSHNIIHIISAISFFGIVFCTMSLIIVLSVFNGFESLIVNYFNSFNADLQINPVKGKVFEQSEFPFEKVKQIEGVNSYSAILEDIALISYDDKQFLAKLKGVDENYGKDNRFDTLIVDGNFLLQKGNIDYVILGAGVAYHLGLNLSQFKTLKTYYPRRTAKNLTDPLNAFISTSIVPSGVFSVQTDYDAEYVFVPLRYAQTLMDYEGKINSVELFLNPTFDSKKIQQKVQQILGESYSVKNKYQQEEMLFKVMQSEKTAIYAILTFIMVLAMFNIIGTLAMLILDKKNDIEILFNMGADRKLIHQIFLWEGFLLNFAGGIIGLMLGALLCVIQQIFGLIKIGSENADYILNTYPVQMSFIDFFAVLIIVITLGLISTILPVKQLTKRLQVSK